MPMMNPEQIGASPAQGNPQMGQTHKLPPDQIAALRKSPNVIAAVHKFTGRDFPMEQIDDQLIVEIAGLVNKLGVDGAVAKAEQLLTPQQKATIRGISMKQRVPMAPQGQPMPPQGGQ
jgi:hypothetical protein